MAERKLIRSDAFGNKLKECRLKRGLSQRELTARMHLLGSSLSSSVYSKIENGDNNMYITDLVIFIMIMEITFDDFFKDMVHEIKTAYDIMTTD